MAYDRSLAEAETQGKSLFSELMDEHQKRQARQRGKGRRAFEARRKAIERVGLPQVRHHRLRKLEREEAEWTERLEAEESALPELTALLLVRIAPLGGAR